MPTTGFPVVDLDGNPVPIFDLADVVVYLNGERVDPGDYTVEATLDDDSTGTYVDAVVVANDPGWTGTVDIVCLRDPARTDQFEDGRGVPAHSINLALNRLTAETQELRRDVARSLKVQYGEDDPGAIKPQARKFLWFDGDGRLATTDIISLGEIALPQITLIFTTRAALANFVALYPVQTGQRYEAEGMQYVGSPGVTAIPDLPGLLPHGKIYPQHFGALGDMTFEVQSVVGGAGEGFVRTGGTDARQAFIMADAYAASVDQPLSLRGRHFIDKEIRPTAFWVADEEWEPILWLRYYWDENDLSISPEPQCGLRFMSSNVGVWNAKLVGQFVAVTSKPGGMGGLGNVWGTSSYLSYTLPPKVENLRMRVLMNRAAHVSGTQQSNGSIMSSCLGYVEKFELELGVWGKTNVATGVPWFAHWGARVDPDTPGYTDSVNKNGADIIETVHSLYGKVSFITPIRGDDGHGFTRPWELAAAGYVTIGAYETDGLVAGAGWLSSGDVCDAFAIASQKGKVGKGINIGKASARNCVMGATSDTGSVLRIKGSGQGGGNSDVYPGTSTEVMRVLEWDVKCEGFDLHMASVSGSTSPSFIQAFNCVGNIDLGVVTTTGPQQARAVYLDHCNAKIDLNLTEGSTGRVLLEWSRGLRLTTGNTRGYAADTSASSAADRGGYDTGSL